MKIEKIKQSNKDLALKFQSTLDFTLPEDYLSFLANNDGARIIDGHFYVEDLKEWILMDLFYGITTQKAINLEYINNKFAEDIPEQSLLIGKDPGGALILLLNGDDKENDVQNGIYFYDHTYFFESSNDENNTYWICNTFTQFLEILDQTAIPE